MTIPLYHVIGGVLKRQGRASVTPPVQSGLSAGSIPVGQASYTVPAGALYVATTGNDTTGTGAIAAPYRSIKAAAAAAPANGTVVVRAGEYHEGGVYPTLGVGITFANSGVTLQNYPGEAVWLDGSVQVTGWSQVGAVWKAPFVLTLDRGKTQNHGESVSGFGSFVVPEFPIANWPEMVLLDGVQLTQVDDIAKVTASTFFVEGAYPNASGTDVNAFRSTNYVIGVNPAGHEVRIGNLARCLGVGQTNVTIRGVGFRRFVPTLQDFGALFIGNTSAAGFRMENCVVEDVSDVGVQMNATDAVLDHVTVQRCGRTGIGGTNCDRSVVQNSLLRNNVNRRFNYGPDAGGLKWTRAWDVIVRFCEFDTNYGHDCWFDESVYRGKVHGNYFHGSYGKGVAYEIGDSGLIVDNIFIDQGIASTDIATRKPQDSNPIWISGSNRCRAWHNTAINSERLVRVAQDSRRPLDAGVFGKDPRQPTSFYQTEMTWDITSVELKNNALIGAAGISQVESAFYSVDDVDNVKTIADYGFKFAGNLYTRPDSTHPARFANVENVSTIFVYFNLTGTPTNDTVPWNTRMSDTGSAFVQNVVGYSTRAKAVLNPTYMNQATPAAVPADVQALLDVSRFTRQRVGAGYLL